MGPRGPATRSIARTCCASRPIAGIQNRPRQAVLSPISMVSRAGWCNVEPRTAYPYLRSVPWRKRKEDRSDASIWAVPCFITRSGFRRRGLSYALARAAVDFAREHGALALEGYPMIPERGKDVPWGELNVGHVASSPPPASQRSAAQPSAAPSCASTSSRARVTFPNAGAVWGSLADYGVAITPTGSGERALEGCPISRPTVRGEHMLDRPLEQRAQPLGDLLGGHAVR